MRKSQLISLRLKAEDLDYVNSLDESYGRTTSEKIRNIIEQSKSKQKSAESFKSAYEYNEENYSASRKKLLFALRENGLRSEILDIFYDWLVNSSALYQTISDETKNINKEEVTRIEREIMDELIFVTDKFLGLGMSESSRVINADYLELKLKSLIFLSSTVEKYLEMKGSK
jgi:predicted DNA-binding protein